MRRIATIELYHIYGTAREYSADIRYRGKLLRSFGGCVPSELTDKATTWARGAGFTGWKVVTP
jgi:hypothetical protein